MDSLFFAGKIVAAIIVFVVLIWPTYLLIWAIIKGAAFVLICPIALPWSIAKIHRVKRGYDPRSFNYTAEELENISYIEIQISNTRRALESTSLAFDRLPKNKNGEVDLRYGGAREAAKARQMLPSKLIKLQTALSDVKDAPHARAGKFVKPLAVRKGYEATLWVVLGLVGFFGVFSWLAKGHWHKGYDVIWQIDPRVLWLILFAIAGAFGLRRMRRFQFSLAQNIIDDVIKIAQSTGSLPEWISGITGPIEPRLRNKT